MSYSVKKVCHDILHPLEGLLKKWDVWGLTIYIYMNCSDWSGLTMLTTYKWVVSKTLVVERRLTCMFTLLSWILLAMEFLNQLITRHPTAIMHMTVMLYIYRSHFLTKTPSTKVPQEMRQSISTAIRLLDLLKRWTHFLME